MAEDRNKVIEQLMEKELERLSNSKQIEEK
jgi:hypothetical protein